MTQEVGATSVIVTRENCVDRYSTKCSASSPTNNNNTHNNNSCSSSSCSPIAVLPPHTRSGREQLFSRSDLDYRTAATAYAPASTTASCGPATTGYPNSAPSTAPNSITSCSFAQPSYVPTSSCVSDILPPPPPALLPPPPLSSPSVDSYVYANSGYDSWSTSRSSTHTQPPTQSTAHPHPSSRSTEHVTSAPRTPSSQLYPAVAEAIAGQSSSSSCSGGPRRNHSTVTLQRTQAAVTLQRTHPLRSSLQSPSLSSGRVECSPDALPPPLISPSSAFPPHYHDDDDDDDNNGNDNDDPVTHSQQDYGDFKTSAVASRCPYKDMTSSPLCDTDVQTLPLQQQPLIATREPDQLTDRLEHSLLQPLQISQVFFLYFH